MQARVAREGEIVVVHLSGRVDVETAEPFRQACLHHLAGKKVVFDFKQLSFVGSSGILPFLETMQGFSEKNPGGFKFSAVGTEFRRVFSATALADIEVYENAPQAVQAFLHPGSVAQALPPMMNPLPAAAAQAAPLQSAPVELLSLKRDLVGEPVTANEEELFEE